MKYLTADEQKTFIKTVKEVKGAERDYVIMETFLNTGLRVSEMAGLTVGDVRNKERMWIRPEIAKRMRRINADSKPRKKGRFVPLHVKQQDLFHTWIAMKLDRQESIEDSAPLFVTRLGAAFTKRALEYMVEKWMIKAGLTSGTGEALFTVHSLRHTFSIRTLERSGQSTKALRSLQKILGHESLASTGIYTEATDKDMAETMHMLSISPTRAQRMRPALAGSGCKREAI